MNYFLATLFFILINFSYGEELYYKKINSEDTYTSLKHPEDCKKIIDINNDNNYEFEKKSNIEKLLSQCKTYIKGSKFKDGVKSGSNAVISTGVKIKDGIKDSIIKGTGSLTGSVVKETEYAVEDTIKLKDGIVGSTSKILNNTLDKGAQIKDGVSSFFKGVFGSEE